VKNSLQSRDALTLKLLGSFFLVFGILVWLGLFWNQPAEGRIVNVCAGIVLLVCGCGSLWWGRRLHSSRGEGN